jgi:hypothetical protein
MKGRYVIEAAVRGCRIDVRLNDVLLFSWPGTFANRLNWFVNQWVVTGENALQVDINEGPSGFDPKSRVEVALNYYEYDPTAIIGKSEHTTILRTEWAPPAPDASESDGDSNDGSPENPLAPEVLDAPPPTYDFPEVLHGLGTINEAQPEWDWTKAEVIVPGPDVIIAVTENVKRLIAAVREKDAAAFDQTLGRVFGDIDIAYGLDDGQTARTMIVKKAWNLEGWDVKDVDTESTEHQLHAQGRLLELTQAGGGPILQAIDGVEKYQFQMRLFFAQIDGDIVIAR